MVSGFGKLRKCYTVQATQYNSYQVAQECSTEDITLQPNQPIKQNTETSAKMKWTNTKLATINLGGGITHISGRQNIVHLMKSNQIEILALQETRVNHCSMEEHDGYTFYFSSGISHEKKYLQNKKENNTSNTQIQDYPKFSCTIWMQKNTA